MSNDERRRLEQIERRPLRDDDPAFAASVGFERPRRRRVMSAGAVFLVGMLVLIAGVAMTQALAVVGVIVGLAGSR